jgi:hypothetical protein
MTRESVRTIGRWAARVAALATGAYAAYVAVTWVRYGESRPPTLEEADQLLDRFMPRYEVADRHHIRIGAPAAITLTAARDMDLFHAPMIQAIFKGRQLLLRAAPDARVPERGFLKDMESIGWRVLAEIPGREVVVGAVTKPWEPDVTFRPIPPEGFEAFDEPDYVKIVWTLRADPVGEGGSIFRTETRVATTDAGARAKFRRYWSCLSPGIKAIRWLTLRPLKAEAERRARALSPTAPLISAPAAHRR